ncbi:MAG: chloride channel protein [Verrucomicrobia bacterium]|nr:chloride channel protein [Verrucomicrobiota bacterium]MCF7709516.1 chloride channel protein [Verrucomicrobiota bacterium]
MEEPPSKTAKRHLGAIHTLLKRYWKSALEIRRHLKITEEAFHLLLAGTVGIIGGGSALLYYYGNDLVKYIALRATGDVAEVAKTLGPVHLILTPTIGGLVAGLALLLVRRVSWKKTSTNLLEVVVAGDGRLPFRAGFLKTVSSIISISTGASIGREGSIIQLSSTLASKWGQLANWHPYRLRLLVACGAASGMAAAYNAPVAGAVFAAQIVLGSFSMNLFAPIVFSSVISCIVLRGFFGIEQLYHVPDFDFTELGQLPWFLLLGIVSGALGAVFLKLLKLSEAMFERTRWPIYIRMSVAGLCVGLIALAFPSVWGNGYTANNQILSQSPELGFLFGLFAAKLVATLITVGAGTVGGVFTPTLLLGAAAGSAFGTTLHQLGFAEALPTGTFAMVGMGSVLAATTHSPLLAMIMLLEMSLNYSAMPPLMLSCAVATLVGRRLHAESVYTESLRRKNLEIEFESKKLGEATKRKVGDIMHAPVPPMLHNTTFPEIAQRFLTSSHNFLPVVDSDERLVGVVALQDLKEHLSAGIELNSVIAYDIMRPVPVALTPNQTLVDALPAALSTDLRYLPVVNDKRDNRLVGALVKAEILGFLSEAIAGGHTHET